MNDGKGSDQERGRSLYRATYIVKAFQETRFQGI